MGVLVAGTSRPGRDWYEYRGEHDDPAFAFYNGWQENWWDNSWNTWVSCNLAET